MATIDDFTSYILEFWTGSYDCADRIVVRGYFKLGLTSGGILIH